MKADTVLTWIQGSKTFVSTDSTGHSIVISTTNENTGMKPSELVLSALAGCTSIDVVDILAKKRTPLTSLKVELSAEQDADPPWTFRKIFVKFILKGKDLKDKDVEQAITLSEEKYCSVYATLSGVAEIITSHEIIDD